METILIITGTAVFCGLLLIVALGIKADNKFRKGIEPGDRCRVTTDWEEIPGTVYIVEGDNVTVITDDNDYIEVDILLIHKP